MFSKPHREAVEESLKSSKYTAYTLFCAIWALQEMRDRYASVEKLRYNHIQKDMEQTLTNQKQFNNKKIKQDMQRLTIKDLPLHDILII